MQSGNILHELWAKRKVTTSFATRRHIVRLNKNQLLLNTLRAKLSPEFLETLERIGKNNRLWLFRFEGVPVVIKDVSDKRHGANTQLIRAAFLAHQQLLRKRKISAEKYILKSPRVYGREGNYLVMEFVDNALNSLNPIPKTYAEASEVHGRITEARNELETNLNYLKSIGAIQMNLQPYSAIPSGVKNGKVVLYLPYDTH